MKEREREGERERERAGETERGRELSARRTLCDRWRMAGRSIIPGTAVGGGAAAAAGSGRAAISFYQLVSKMKTTPRTGWVNNCIPSPESIADHSYRVAMMAMVAAPIMGLDVGKCVSMAIAHDLAESIVGDITPRDPVTKEEKRDMEHAAMQDIRSMIDGVTTVPSDTAATDCPDKKSGSGERSIGSYVESLWREYDDGESSEAILLKDLDKLEMILQAHEYEVANDRYDLDSFFDSTRGNFRTSVGREWAEEVERLRNERHGAPERGGS